MSNTKTEPMSFRTSDETKERWEAFKTNIGKSTAEDAFCILLNTYESQQQNMVLNAPMLSSAINNIPVITKYLQTALEQMAATIFLAEQGAAVAQSQAVTITEQAQGKIHELVESNKAMKLELQRAKVQETQFKTEADELSLKIQELRDQSESISVLKASWADRESDIMKQVAEWKSRAASADNLQKSLEETHRKLETTETSLARTETEFARLNEAHAKTQEALDAENTSRSNLQAKAAELAAEVRALNNQIAASERRLTEYHGIVLNLKQAVDSETNARIFAEQAYAVSQAQLEAANLSRKTEPPSARVVGHNPEVTQVEDEIPDIKLRGRSHSQQVHGTRNKSERRTAS